MKWVSIKDSGYPCPPDKSAWVLVYADGAVNCMAYSEGMWKDWTNASCHNIAIEDITHWMKIPELIPEGLTRKVEQVVTEKVSYV